MVVDQNNRKLAEDALQALEELGWEIVDYDVDAENSYSKTELELRAVKYDND